MFRYIMNKYKMVQNKLYVITMYKLNNQHKPCIIDDIFNYINFNVVH